MLDYQREDELEELEASSEYDDAEEEEMDEDHVTLVGGGIPSEPFPAPAAPVAPSKPRAHKTGAKAKGKRKFKPKVKARPAAKKKKQKKAPAKKSAKKKKKR